MLEEDLSLDEKLYLWRRRPAADGSRWTQQVAADHFGVSLSTYQRWENGTGNMPDVELEGLDPWEHYIVLRLRSGLGITECARRMGLSREYLRRIEYGEVPLDRCIDFWGE